MSDYNWDADILRYSRQVVLKAMDKVRSQMRGSERLAFKETVDNTVNKMPELNLTTKAIDQETERLMISSLRKKFSKIESISSFTIFSEELGIATFPEGADENQTDIVVFIDPFDGTEFVETLQGGWCLLAVYDRRSNEMIAAVAGDIFFDRLYWASRSTAYAEGLDFITHSWFKLDGGPNPKSQLRGAKVNFLTTKVSRYLSVARQDRLLKEIEKDDGRINLSWGSNTIIQVAAGNADVAIEFAKGFAPYDILPGLFIGEKAGLNIIDLNGDPLSSQIDIQDTFRTYRKDPKKPKRIPFIAAKNPELTNQVFNMLQK